MSDETAYHNENFPVGMMIPSKLRPLVDMYYQSARFADNIADSNILTKEDKIAKLENIRKAFLAPENGNNLLLIRNLGKMFVKERLDASLYTDLLKAFEKDASKTEIQVWEELVDYCRYSAAPVGRFMLAISDENLSTYLPAENLCVLLQLIDHISDIKEDLSLLGRVYIPAELMQKHNVRKSDLGLSYTKPEVKQMLDEIVKRMEKMQDDAQILPRLIKKISLRAEIGVILSLTNSMIKKYKKVDVLQKSPKPSCADWIKAFVKGCFGAVFYKKVHQGRVL